MAKDIRFKWKDELRQERGVTRGAKHFGCYMVDRRIFKAGGKCTERNKTLAAGMGVSVRSLQRYVRELEVKGWIIVDRVSGPTRTIRLRYPWRDGGASRHDTQSLVTATQLSAKHDTAVTPNNKNKHVKKNDQQFRQNDTFAVVRIQCSEGNLLEAWNHWIQEHSDYCFEEVLNSVASRATYDFPSRYPPDEETKIAKCLGYFSAMLARSRSRTGQDLH